MKGLWLTFKHLRDARHLAKPIGVDQSNYFLQDKGIVTLEYPYQAIPVPDNGRYRLHNEIDDCIVCDKCAKVCPVDCIDIVPIKSTEEIGVTSDGTSKRLYAATFDIDMAKCCYCGLCTTVCPTECLTMTQTFDYSEFDVRNMNYHFTDLTPEMADEKRRLYEQKQAEKAATQAAKATPTVQEVKQEESGTPKPVFKPKFPSLKPTPPIEEKIEDVPSAEASAPKPVFRPKMPAPKAPPMDEGTPSVNVEPLNTGKQEEPVGQQETAPAPKPVFRPKIPMPKKPEEGIQGVAPENTIGKETKEPTTAIPAPKPVFKPKIPMPKKPEEQIKASEPENTAFGPLKEETVLVPSAEDKVDDQANESSTELPAPPKPVYKPKMKPIIPPKNKDQDATSPNTTTE